MKKKIDFNNILKKTTIISAIFFGVAIAIIVGIGEEEIPWPLGILFLLSMITVLLCLVTAWILDLIEEVRTNKVSYFREYVMQIIVFFIVCMVMDYFLDKVSGNWIGCLVRSVGMVCGIRAFDYIWIKGKRM